MDEQIVTIALDNLPDSMREQISAGHERGLQQIEQGRSITYEDLLRQYRLEPREQPPAG